MTIKALLSTRPRCRALRTAEYGLVAAGVLAFAYCASVIVKSRLFQWSESNKFHAALESRSAPRLPVIASGTPRDGSVLGQLSIPRLDLDVMVVEGVGEGDLKHAIGHIPGTALPGQGGNLGIAGHRDTYFRPLRLIRHGDKITLKTLAAVYTYKVVATGIVEPEDVQVLEPDGKDSLTLVTCFPFYYVGPAPKRFIIRAERLPGV